MVTHDMHLMLEYTNNVVVLADGKVLASDIPEKILTNKEVIKNANLKETSLQELAINCEITDTNYDRQVRKI